jgi:hypothetical protein
VQLIESRCLCSTYEMSFRAIMVPNLELDRRELIHLSYSTLMKFTIIHEFGRAGGMKSDASRRVRRANLKA